jgi:hypothetical protein
MTNEERSAPTLADDVAALRAGIEDAYTPLSAMGLLAALDRIAARVPQRATRLNGRAMWQHTACGSVMAFTGSPSLCNCRDMVGEWRALYVLPDGA